MNKEKIRIARFVAVEMTLPRRDAFRFSEKHIGFTTK